MGNFLFKKILPRREVIVLIVGLSSTGKTTMLYKLKQGEAVSVVPTLGFNVETIDHNNVNVTFWDVSVGDKMLTNLKHYLPGKHGLIFVINSTDRERLDEAFTEILKPLSENDEIAGAPVLVLANKQDLEGAMTPDEITHEIEKAGLLNAHPWKVFGTTALQKEGLNESLDWLTDAITEASESNLIDKLMNSVNKSGGN